MFAGAEQASINAVLVSQPLAYRKGFSVFLWLMVACRQLTLASKIGRFAASSLEFHDLSIQAMDADEGTDNKIGGGNQQDHAKGGKDIHPIHRLNEGIVSISRGYVPGRRYLRQDDCDTDPDDFQVGSLLLEKGLNFFHDQRVYIFGEFSIHGSSPLSMRPPNRYLKGSRCELETGELPGDRQNPQSHNAQSDR